MNTAHAIFASITRHKTATYGLSNCLVGAIGIILIVGYKPGGTGHAVGESLLAAAVVGLVFLLYTWLDLSDRATEEQLEEGRITGVYENRTPEESADFGEAIRQARHNVDLLGFGLRSFRQTSIVGGDPWPEKARVRILLIDPDYPNREYSYADQRDVEETTSFEQNRIDVEEFVKTCRTHLESEGDLAQAEGRSPRLDIRLFRCLPSITVLRVDHVLYWGPYLMGRANVNCPLVRAEAGGFLFEQLVGHFEEIWSSNDRSRAVPEEWMT